MIHWQVQWLTHTQMHTNKYKCSPCNAGEFFYENSWSIEVTSTAKCSKNLSFFLFFCSADNSVFFSSSLFFLILFSNSQRSFLLVQYDPLYNCFSVLCNVILFCCCLMKTSPKPVQPYTLFEFIHFVLKASEGNVSKQHKTTYVSSTD